ncbi:DUF3108 domain-containing protein [Paraferrimonas sp. SM1919]|uniref:DUF3108 domain-containing protein n=1 Tax=Paraferrimonas sp. SM1919 TaxID=2662263 RepID=UPI0013D8D72C|nr:DUF3108 domain-containing protein [Paraferrimonas sp. SM1919]
MKFSWYSLSLCILPFCSFASANVPIPFEAHYQVHSGVFKIGGARYTFEHLGDDRYTLKFDSEAKLSPLYDRRNITSTFSIVDNQLVPERYIQDRKTFGLGDDYKEQMVFVADMQKVHTRYKGIKQSFDYSNMTFDPLAVQMQFRLGLINQTQESEFTYEILKTQELDTYTLAKRQVEDIEIDAGKFKALRVEVVRDSKKRQTLMWFATEYDYLPLRISHIENGFTLIDMQLTHFISQESAINWNAESK